MEIERKLETLLNIIVNDNVNGSITIAKKIIAELELLATKSTTRELNYIINFIPNLINVKPTMAVIENSLKYLLHRIKENEHNNFPKICEYVLNTMNKATNAAVNEAYRYVSEKFTNYDLSIITTSFSSTVLSLLKKIHSKFKLNVYALESFFKGVSYSSNFVQSCQRFSINCKEIKYDELLENKFTFDFAITGADRIIKNKAIINGTPSLLLAESSLLIGIPFYVIAESFKVTSMIIVNDGFDTILWNLITRLFTDNILQNNDI